VLLLFVFIRVKSKSVSHQHHDQLVIEERLFGKEVSYFALCDGKVNPTVTAGGPCFECGKGHQP
jgi:phosphoribosylamine-glycine ligase